MVWRTIGIVTTPVTWSAARLSRGLAFLFMLVLVANPWLIEIPLRQLGTDPFGIVSLLTSALLVLLIGSIIGLRPAVGFLWSLF